MSLDNDMETYAKSKGKPLTDGERDAFEAAWVQQNVRCFQMLAVYTNSNYTISRAVRLIAAAPDLLAASKALVERWHTPKWKDAKHTGYYIDYLEAAIAKAEGETK